MFAVRQAARVLRRFGGQNSIVFRHVSVTSRTYSAKIQCKKYDNVETNLNKSIEENDKKDTKQALAKIEAKLQIIFTCKKCDTKNDKIISKIAYQKGVVIIRCDGCQNNHLIADNLGWFKELGKNINIEKILAEKGETVQRIQYHTDGLSVIAQEEVCIKQGENSNENKNELNPTENKNIIKD